MECYAAIKVHWMQRNGIGVYIGQPVGPGRAAADVQARIAEACRRFSACRQSLLAW
jgi:hypothetical protein